MEFFDKQEVPDSPDKLNRAGQSMADDDLEDKEDFQNQRFRKLELEGKLDPGERDDVVGLGQKNLAELDDRAREGKHIRPADMKLYKGYLMTKIGAPFVTNVLRVALNYKEEVIAGLLVMKYKKILLDKLMLVRAIKTNQMYFLYCVWAYNKNYARIPRIWSKEDDERDPGRDGDVLSDESRYESQDSNGAFQARRTEGRYRTYTYDFLIKLVLQHAPETANEKIRAIAKWGLESNENMLRALLVNRQDKLAIAFERIEAYSANKDIALFVFCIRN